MATSRDATRRASPTPRVGVARRAGPTPADIVIDREDASLLDLLDNALTKGIVLTGDLTLGLARIDLIYARLSLLLCAADRVLPYTDARYADRRLRRPPAVRRAR